MFQRKFNTNKKNVPLFSPCFTKLIKLPVQNKSLVYSHNHFTTLTIQTQPNVIHCGYSRMTLFKEQTLIDSVCYYLITVANAGKRQQNRTHCGTLRHINTQHDPQRHFVIHYDA